MSDNAIIATNLSRKFGDFIAVDNLNLVVPKGTIYGFLGPNGCGKSTTLRMLTGLLTPTTGTVNVLGLDIPHQAEQLRLRIGYMTQKFSLYQDLTIQENLEFMGQIFGIPRAQRQQRVQQQLITYGLDQRAKRRAGELSGGQRQRLALAAATIHQPDLLLLDEPTSAVDPENRREFWEQLFDLSDQGTTILVTTHYMDEAERCHELAIMEAGVVRANGTPNALMMAMAVTVVEIETQQLRQLKAQIIQLPQVRSAAQLGVRLRVLVSKEIDDPVGWLQAKIPILATAIITISRPSLEDVFVTCTGERRQ
ncbi:ATP-binding cassette domain-containing protein [Photobacterium phosphoreum]|jgi:ABC-2 type transport system ATP-binding protein|uniref:ATP-binding cassette domain-containing protein n=1 Tax=Photobacterium phosphoreum TaxID=659 RepID=A0AAW4ZL81_PHOPO|nr:ABC transporter ATP-binding protein [Photobacterium phosphoreum]MCD9469631.1 ABC transporter ATP-binding protein [Photobacterium phosphoreum]MCD9473684.1 ATP-binding cassette domain-containing protein [Photobacterium phosphoreum]MCD9478565.1 ATP-binding cassette domain-containing protein [Photobacterium phosphoreum]MCD9483570.1 ATP-binding cassette domain-containing protein [Photobacterium phosphoreum]MCD9489724.1 ATP-binding cassette domain-containing protein [Photobacterium phosphoreum]